MKAIVCEMCNSNDIVKQDGFYVCQSCGTKYRPEEAKKLMIEISGNVDISGSTAKIDHTDAVNNYYILARRAAEEGNYEKAAEYYRLLSINRPNDWEANFYSVCLSAFACEFDEIGYNANIVTSRISSTMSLIQRTVDEDGQKKAYSEVAKTVSQLREELFQRAKDAYFEIENYPVDVYKHQCFLIYKMETELAENLWEIFKEKDLSMEHLRVCNTEESNINRDSIFELMELIDPEAANEAREEYKLEKERSAATKKRKLFGSAVLIVLGIVLFIVSFLLHAASLHVCFIIVSIFVFLIGVFFFVHLILQN